MKDPSNHKSEIEKKKLKNAKGLKLPFPKRNFPSTKEGSFLAIFITYCL
jgi:hypothetical protein